MSDRRLVLSAGLCGLLGLAGCSEPKEAGPVLLTKNKGQALARDMDWAELDKQTTGFWLEAGVEVDAVKDPRKALYVFFDMQCPHCGELWKDYRMAGLGSLAVKWIPVGLLNRASTAQGATLLSKKVGQKAVVLDEHESKMKAMGPRGGISADGAAFGLFEDKIAKNTGILMGLLERMPKGESGVPFLVGVAMDGSVYLNAGRPAMGELRGKLRL